MNNRFFIYGETGSGKTAFAHRYAKDNLITFPLTSWGFSKAYNCVKRRVTNDSVFLWDLFEHQSKGYTNWISKVDKLKPNHSHIICSIYPPEHYNKRIQTFIKDYNFIPIKLNDDSHTPWETVKQHLDNLILTL